MDGTRDTINLTIVQGQLRAGLVCINKQLDLIELVTARGGDTSKEHIELWRMEHDQADLADTRSSIVARLGEVGTALVVLVVEDDPLTLMATAADLRAAGFSVVEAANSNDAIEALTTNSTIGAMFTDVQMPGAMDGLELARHVHGRWPLIKVIVTSGDTQFGFADLLPGHHFLPKPYGHDELVIALKGS
jgi:CheY-like chemotaxis protein